MLNLATRHKAQAYNMIDTLGEDILIRQPPARTTSTSDVDKVFGAPQELDDYGELTTVTGHVHQGTVPGDASGYNFTARFLGIMQNADLVVSVKLEDVLSDSTKKYGRTLFDTAKDVVVGGSVFEVTGAYRSGMAPLGPYILWVGLEIQGE